MNRITRGLSEIIIGLGEQAATNLPNIYQHGWELPMDNSAHVREVTAAIDKEEVIQIMTLAYRLKCFVYCREGNEHIPLAARISGHDLGNMMGNLDMSFSDFIEHQSKENASSLVKAITNVRTTCLSMAYLASEGNTVFLSTIPIAMLPQMMDKRFFDRQDVGDGPDLITSAQYFSLHQLFKNAGEANLTTGVKDGYQFLSVSDRGKGVIERAQVTVPDIGMIFGEFSSRQGGGVGLQVAKRLTELQGGFVEVETRSPSTRQWLYNTRSDTVREVEMTMEHGSTFTIYTPSNI